MSGQKGNYPQAPKYINDFSKALAGEVRILLQEVGKLRDERRQLQQEIAELMTVKAKYSSGGDYAPAWAPNPEPAPAALPPPPPPAEIEPAGPAPSAWRTVHKRPGRREKKEHKALPAPPPPPAIEAPPPPNLPAWAQWRPNPLFTPQPVSASPVPAPPRPGLFGPSTPPPK
ncbi:hypothetical protein NM688_g3287 [Phlebia brevispora]|uniref:Uncharacterized protein n=1 Tax=Phlebia brevispora TaxID=194682 RepID=A0ACC1T5Z2_9APHY|nr:hypothetical protein NM688_g3287 [Phlebia brevispora]